MEPAATEKMGMDAKRFWIGFAILAVVALLPILVTEIPAYADYPNHLARTKVLAHYDESAFYREFWRPAWAILPNILTDVLLFSAAKLLPITVAGRVVLGLVIVTLGAGFAAARRQATGRYDALGFGGLLLAYGFPVHMGFFNFSLGVGLLLALFALHLKLRERGTAIYLAALIPASLVLFLCHLMAFVLFGMIVTVWEIAQKDRSRLGRAALRMILVAIVPAILFVKSPTNGQVSTWDGSSAMMKLRAIPLSFAVGDWSADLFFGLAAVLIVGALVLSRARWSRPALAVIVLIALLFLAAPFGLGTTKNLDNRIPFVLAFFALALVVPTQEKRRPEAWLGLVAGAIVLHSGLLSLVAYRRGHAIDEVRAQLRTLPENALLFNAVDEAQPVWRFSTWNPPLPSAHTLALIDREIYPSGLFMIPGQQPLLIKPGLEALYWARSGADLDPDALAAEIAGNLRPLPAEIRNRPRFLMVCGPERPRPGPTLFAAGPRYAIYRLPAE